MTRAGNRRISVGLQFPASGRIGPLHTLYLCGSHRGAEIPYSASGAADVRAGSKARPEYAIFSWFGGTQDCVAPSARMRLAYVVL